MRSAILGPDGRALYLGWQGKPVVTDPPDEPPPPGIFTHGTQVRRNNVGRSGAYYAGDVRAPLAAPTEVAGRNYTTADSNSTVTNVKFTNNVVNNADLITFVQCEFGAPASDAGGKYLFTNDAGRVIFDRCTFFGRYGHGKTLYQRGRGGMWFKQSLIAGSEDIVHAGPGSGGNATQPWPTYAVPDFTGAQLIFEECFLGDGVRYASGHIDGVQFDTRDAIRVGNAAFVRCKMLAHSVNSPAGPPSAQGDPNNPANAAFIATHGATPGVHGWYGIYDSQLDGGNYTVNATPPDGPAPQIMAMRGNKVGHDVNFTHAGQSCMGGSRFGTGMTGGGAYRSNNTWLRDGKYVVMGGGSTPVPTFYDVLEGQPVNV